MTVTPHASLRIADYRHLRSQRPQLFHNPDGAPIEVLVDGPSQQQVSAAEVLAAPGLGRPAEHDGVGVVYQDRWITVIRDAVRFPNGALGAYVRICTTSDGVGAAVLPVLSDDRVMLLRHFRHADRQWHWEIPRGGGEAGATAEATARREVEEEIGCRVTELIYLGDVHPDTGIIADRAGIFLARLEDAALPGHLTVDAFAEGIDTLRAVSPDELAQMILSNQVTDSFTLSAFTHARIRCLV